MNFKNIAFVDCETTSVDTNKCSIVQIAVKVIDPRTLTPIDNAEFNGFMKPLPGTLDKETTRFHAQRLKMSEEDVLSMWETYPEPKYVWPELVKFLNEYHTTQTRRTIHTAPIAAGANILKFDIPIIDRYNDLYGEKTAGNNPRPLFHGRDKIEILHWLFAWFENSSDLENYRMDTVREYFGMDQTNAHDALQDVRDCAEITTRFMKLHRATAAKVQFKGAIGREKV